jgi:hypothetical protein
MRPRPAVVACVAAVAALSLAGCGSAEEPPVAEPTPVAKDVAECREQWRDLGETVADRVEGESPSALASRWTSLVATIDYYATSAKESDCDDRLAEQRTSITALESFAASLRRWDLEHQLAVVESDARTYATSPRPKAPKRKNAERPPRPAAVLTALRLLARQAPRASEQQRPGWQQAAATDLSDRAAVAKARKDLAFLSEESPAYRQGAAALRVIRSALQAS